jgi:outer membrane protein TolC
MVCKRIFLAFLTTWIFQFSFSQNNNLDFYLEQAMLNSPLLKDYKNQVQSNQLDSQRIRAVYKPQINGNSVNYYAPTVNGYGYDFAVTNGAQVSAQVGVNLQIISKENLNTQLSSIQLQNQAIGNNARMTEQELKRTISAQYILAYSDLQQMQFTGDIIGLLKKEEVILKQLTEKNVYRQTEYLTFLVALRQQQLNYRQVNLQFRNNYALLNYLSGITDTSGANLQEPGIRLNSLPESSLSVFFHQFLIDSLKLLNSRSLVSFAYKPKLNVYADGGYLSSMYYRPYKNFGLSAGFSLLVPIYDGHQRKLQYNKLSIAEQTRSNYKDFFKKQYDQQLNQLQQQLNGTIDLQKEINEQVIYSESLIKVNARLLETGDLRIADYIIALNSYLNAKYLLTQNNITRLQIINQINYWNR